MASQKLLRQILTSTSAPPQMLMEIAVGDVTLLMAALQVNTLMTINANVSAHHTLAVT
jgi:hypothetical protein